MHSAFKQINNQPN